MVERERQSTEALARGERRIGLHDLLAVYHRVAVRRWRVEPGDIHDMHHVLLGRMPEGRPEGRWYVDSTYHAHRDVWVYPTVSGAMWRVDQLRADRLDWDWTEVPPTPYDTELGAIPDGDE